jgi:predicted aspartyl protease
MMIVEGQTMGRFAIEFEVANNQDIYDALSGRMDPAKVRRLKIKGTVDPGATLIVLPESVVKKLGLPMKKSKIKVRYVDGRRGLRAEADEVRVFLQGRDATFNAIVEPKRETALIGAVVLETLDFLVDSRKERLVPRDPDHIVSEVE